MDAATDAEYVDFLRSLEARTEPTQEMYAPRTARGMWSVLRAIDWTHMHHEQTYDVMAAREIAWADKAEWLRRSLRYYLETNEVAFSPAPLDVTMRRAGVMMKPYFTLFRNRYPRSNDFFYAAHWWHPSVYEAQVVGGPEGQDELVREADRMLHEQVLEDRPQRMLLGREVMPRYSRLDPGSTNAFDNLHMFHGIVYDVLAYEGWSVDEQRAELYRVIEAMGRQPGDEALARKFATPHPDLEPAAYDDWMKGVDGEMTRIMREMHEEMMPLMMPEGMAMSEEQHARVQEVLRQKLSPGLDEGEHPGSLHEALMEVMPDMRMAPESMAPGATPRAMVAAMLRGWEEEHGAMADVAPLPMEGGAEGGTRP